MNNAEDEDFEILEQFGSLGYLHSNAHVRSRTHRQGNMIPTLALPSIGHGPAAGWTVPGGFNVKLVVFLVGRAAFPKSLHLFYCGRNSFAVMT